MADYKVPFWRNQLLLGTSHPVISLVHEYEKAERERELRKGLGDVRLMTPDQLFKEFRDGDAGE